MTPEYSHTQNAPLCVLIYALAIGFLLVGFFAGDAPPIQRLFPSFGLLILVLAGSFHHLNVEDHGDVLAGSGTFGAVIASSCTSRTAGRCGSGLTTPRFWWSFSEGRRSHEPWPVPPLQG
jgi:hypothetical protein